MTILVPFVPTPLPVARKMLELVNASNDDIVYDLGCGDGRIPIIAVREFGVRKAVCIEIRKELAKKAKENIKALNLENKVIVINNDMFNINISEATIVTLFLLTSVNDALAEKFRTELKKGARIVSHEFRITKWNPIIFSTINDGRVSHNIYVYVRGFSDSANET